MEERGGRRRKRERSEPPVNCGDNTKPSQPGSFDRPRARG